MEYDLSPETNELRDLVRGFLERRAPEDRVRQVVADGTGRDGDLWRQMAEQVGLQGLLIPEALGGQGTTLVEACVVLEEMGRAATPAPFLTSSVIAASALSALADSSADKLLHGIAEGTTVATVAFQHPSSGVGGSTVTAAHTNGGDVWTLDGAVDIVLDAPQADTLLVVAPADDDLGLFMVDAEDPGVRLNPLTCMDLTRPAAQLTLQQSSATRLGGGFSQGQDHTLLVARAAIASEMAGALQRLLELSVDYAKIREQFGKPIGTFQAVKHLCADIYVVAESSIAVARHAVRALVDAPENATEAVSVAKAYLSAEGPTAAEKALQVHGGIGFTWEHPVHLYLRKVASGAHLFGDAAAQRARLAQALSLSV